MTDERLLARYRQLLGVASEPTSLQHLTALTGAQLRRVPFENLGKLLRRRRGLPPALPTLQEHLDGIEHHRLGGTCYANNHYLNELLRFLGYDARLCGADMSQPDVHLVNIVALEGREYLVDGGYGAPFLEPIPLDAAENQVVTLGRDRYVLEPRQAEGRSRLVHYREGRVRHGYEINPRPRCIEEFMSVVTDSFRDDAVFMNIVRFVHFTLTGSLSLRNLGLVVSDGDRWREEHLADREELCTTVAPRLGIAPELMREATTGLDLEAVWEGSD